MIINLSGSVKAVREQFSAIESIIPHAVDLIKDNKLQINIEHDELQKPISSKDVSFKPSRVSNQPQQSSNLLEYIIVLNYRLKLMWPIVIVHHHIK